MKKRKPIAVFFLTGLTLGIYYHYWIYVNLRDINKIQAKNVFNTARKMTYLIIFYLFNLVSYFFFRLQASSSDVLFKGRFVHLIIWILGLLWTVANLKYIWQICSQINEIEFSKRIEKKINKVGITILMFVLGIGVINIQMHMNEIIDKIYGNQLNNNHDSIIQRRRPIRGRI